MYGLYGLNGHCNICGSEKTEPAHSSARPAECRAGREPVQAYGAVYATGEARLARGTCGDNRLLVEPTQSAGQHWWYVGIEAPVQEQFTLDWFSKGRLLQSV